MFTGMQCFSEGSFCANVKPCCSTCGSQCCGDLLLRRMSLLPPFSLCYWGFKRENNNLVKEVVSSCTGSSQLRPTGNWHRLSVLFVSVEVCKCSHTLCTQLCGSCRLSEEVSWERHRFGASFNWGKNFNFFHVVHEYISLFCIFSNSHVCSVYLNLVLLDVCLPSRI